MKTVTVSTILALLVAIPFLMKKREPRPVEIRADEGNRSTDEIRYDIDDFLTLKD